MATCTRLTVVKQFPYRGNPTEEFSNTYTFKSPPPGDAASWQVLLNDVVQQERPCFTTVTTWVRAYGYDSNDPKDHHVFAHDFLTPGPPPAGLRAHNPATMFAGDQAAVIWFKLDRLSSKGKPTYLRKYFHDGAVNDANQDGLEEAYHNILETFTLPSGIQSVHGGLQSPGSVKLGIEPGGNVVAAGASGWVTTRTLKRRGKRPLTGN